MAQLQLIEPDWPAPVAVQAWATTRVGGSSLPPYASLNLGRHVDDEPDRVAANRAALRAVARLPDEPCWLEQVHGTRIVPAGHFRQPPTADGVTADQPGLVCVVLTADCLPVLLCDRAGTRVAAVHAGWRGLAQGILEVAVADFGRAGIPGSELLAWLGPAIGAAAYEVGPEVRAAFQAPGDASGFVANAAGRWQCDLAGLARGRLQAAGLDRVYGGDRCTHSDSEQFFSYRRDGSCGRQASLIWLEPAAKR
ncbi:MAG: peptidoglycan editing factor PgeF [Gammaproteobacteria bacterium]